MRGMQRSLLSMIVFLSMAQAGLSGAETPQWRVNGNLNTRLDFYHTSGNKTAGLFTNTGEQYFSELNTNFQRQNSRYDTITGNAGMLVNVSDFRSQERGLIVERVRVKWEKGDAPVPFRATGGDFLGFTSIRTLQRSLKGGMVELQPRLGGKGLRHSIQLFSGLNTSIYRNLDKNMNWFNGLSWLVQQPKGGRLAVNLVQNYVEATSSAPSRSQIVGSVAGAWPWTWKGQQFSLETELGILGGEHAASLGKSQTDLGIFSELRGQSLGTPLRYRFLYERYGDDYRPGGAQVAADRESMEAHGTWRFQTGQQLQGRLQHFVDALESANSRDTLVGGLRVSGPSVFREHLSSLRSSYDLFFRDVADENNTFEQDSLNFRANWNMPFGTSWRADWGMSYRDTNTLSGGSSTETRVTEFTARLNRSWRWDEWQGNVGPGLAVRLNRGDVFPRNEIMPTLVVSVSGKGHRFQADYRLQRQHQRTTGANDVDVHDLNVAYSFRTGKHELGFDGQWNRRIPETVARTDSYRVGMFYRFYFTLDSRRQTQPRISDTQAPEKKTADAGRGSRHPGSFLLLQLTPGVEMEDAIGQLESEGYAVGSPSANLLAVETQVLARIDERQRLVLQRQGDRIGRTVIVIDPEQPTPSELSQLFVRTREALVRRLGTPERSLVRGEFNATINSGLVDGSFARVDEWLIDGDIVRLGIPRRLDGQLRIEIHYAHELPAPTQQIWGLESLRE